MSQKEVKVNKLTKYSSSEKNIMKVVQNTALRSFYTEGLSGMAKQFVPFEQFHFQGCISSFCDKTSEVMSCGCFSFATNEGH